MKRRAAIVTAVTALLTVAGTSVARADLQTSINLSRDTSGCIVVFPGSDHPITVCFFPRT